MEINVLPPVGQRILWQPSSSEESACSPTTLFPDHHVTWLASGTAALALAIHQVLALDPGRKEVLLPGYGCPDLIAACIHAGAVPRLVDCATGEPGFDLGALRDACGPATAAVVAVNFLGISERLPELHTVATAAGAALIEDCAQWFPEAPAQVPVAARIVSFGRGKPVNLLGGGALLLPPDSPLQPPSPPPHTIKPLSRLKAAVFNQLLNGFAYGVITRAPGLELGATRYHPLDAIEGMDAVRKSLAPANVNAWLRRRLWRQELLTSELTNANVQALPLTLASRSGRLLRYPLLCRDRSVRDRLLAELQPLGASGFYGNALAEVEGVPEILATMPGRTETGNNATSSEVPGGDPASSGPPQHPQTSSIAKPALSNAREFANRLLTLPLHDGVHDYHLRRMAAAVRAAG